MPRELKLTPQPADICRGVGKVSFDGLPDLHGQPVFVFDVAGTVEEPEVKGEWRTLTTQRAKNTTHDVVHKARFDADGALEDQVTMTVSGQGAIDWVAASERGGAADKARAYVNACSKAGEVRNAWPRRTQLLQPRIDVATQSRISSRLREFGQGQRTGQVLLHEQAATRRPSSSLL